jgi:hypothetical protein
MAGHSTPSWQCRLSQLPGNKTAAPVSSCNRALRIKVVAAGSRQGLKGKLLEKCNSPAITGLRFRKQAESFLSRTTNAALETRLVRTHGTGRIFTALVLREKHVERPRDFAHLTDSKAISRLAKALSRLASCAAVYPAVEIEWEGSMQFRTALSLAALFVVCFRSGLWDAGSRTDPVAQVGP